MKYLTASCAILILSVAPLWAECLKPLPTAAAAGWNVHEEEYAWFATNPEYPDVRAELFMNSPSIPQVLDWTTPDRYGGRIGVLQYFAGEPGTSYLVKIISNVVIDLNSGKTLGEGSYSEDCEIVSWHWSDSKVVVEDTGNGEVVINLP